MLATRGLAQGKSPERPRFEAFLMSPITSSAVRAVGLIWKLLSQSPMADGAIRAGTDLAREESNLPNA
jgi:hypothetical protein